MNLLLYLTWKACLISKGKTTSKVWHWSTSSSLKDLLFPKAMDIEACTFGFLFEHGLYIGEAALRLPHWIHTVNVVSVQGFIEDDDGYVGDTA